MTYLPACHLLALVLVSSISAQRDIVMITTKAEIHQDALISPDGTNIAFRGPSKISVVSYTGGKESSLVSGLNLGDFLWSPNSSGVYFMENDQVRFVAKNGGNPKVIAKLPGQQHRLWDVDSKDGFLFGTRFDSSNRTYKIFELATDGRSAPKDLVSSAFLMDEVDLDPGGTRLLFRRYSPQPFQPREYLHVDRGGKKEVSLTGKPIGGQIQHGRWVDSGKSIVFSILSSASSTWQLARIGPVGTKIRMLTEGFMHRFSAVSGNLKWVVMQATDGKQLTAAIVPVDGGGAIMLGTDGLTYQFHGPPSIDRAGQHVAFAAKVSQKSKFSQIFMAELDREIRISPRAEIGKPLGLEMPLPASQIGGVFLSNAIGTKALAVPGHLYGIVLNPALILVVKAGRSSNGKLSVTLPVPNNPWLVGQNVYFQGLRTTGSTGDFTRYIEVRFY